LRSDKYDNVRKNLLPGDIIAFGGRGLMSEAIKAYTRCSVSHVGIVMQTGFIEGEPIVLVCESTSLGDGFAGVQISRLSVRVATYDGEMWWLPLNPVVREELDVIGLQVFLARQVGKEYDAIQAIGSALDKLVPDNREDMSKLFCSELCTAAFEDNLGDTQFVHKDPDFIWTFKNINASEQTPLDVVRFPIYGEVVQLKGDPLPMY